jgi:hypothetical protein
MRGGLTEKQQLLRRNRELASQTLKARLQRNPQQRDVMTLLMIRRDPAKRRSEDGFIRSLAEKYKGLRIRKTRKYHRKPLKLKEKTPTVATTETTTRAKTARAVTAKTAKTAKRPILAHHVPLPPVPSRTQPVPKAPEEPAPKAPEEPAPKAPEEPELEPKSLEEINQIRQRPAPMSYM